MQIKKVGIIVSIVIGIAVISTISLGQYNYQEDTYIYSIDQKTLFSKLENNEPIFIVDIRTAEEFQAGHLDGASHDILDSTTLEKRVTTIQNRLPEVASKYNLVLVDDD